MSKFSMKSAFSILALMACVLPQMAQAGLDGEPAAALNIGEWVKGTPVEINPGTNLYVVEIFSTTSAASRTAVTNLNYLQNLYRTNGLIVIGICDDPAPKITNFVTQSGLNIDYWIAGDNKRHTALTYMDPVMQRAIPYAFLVGTNGDLLWHGSPLGGLGTAVTMAVHGKYDEARAKKDDLSHHQLEQYLALARQGSDRATMAGQALLAARTNDVGELCEMAFQIATSPKIAKRDFALGGQALDEAEKLAPTNSVQVTISRAIWLFESGNHDGGLMRATQALAMAGSDMQRTNIENCIQTMKKRENPAANHPNGANPEDSGFKPNHSNAGQPPGSGAAGSP
jgi:hypothetical protein